jgi:hypothetical protein
MRNDSGKRGSGTTNKGYPDADLMRIRILVAIQTADHHHSRYRIPKLTNKIKGKLMLIDRNGHVITIKREKLDSKLQR